MEGEQFTMCQRKKILAFQHVNPIFNLLANKKRKERLKRHLQNSFYYEGFVAEQKKNLNILFLGCHSRRSKYWQK